MAVIPANTSRLVKNVTSDRDAPLLKYFSWRFGRNESAVILTRTNAIPENFVISNNNLIPTDTTTKYHKS